MLSFFCQTNSWNPKDISYFFPKHSIFTKFLNKGSLTTSCPTHYEYVALKLSIIDVLSAFDFQPKLSIKSKMLCCLCSLYKSVVCLSNLVQSTFTTLEFCSRILFKSLDKVLLSVLLFLASRGFLFRFRNTFQFSVLGFFYTLLCLLEMDDPKAETILCWENKTSCCWAKRI